MAELNEADKYLLEGIRSGSQDAWSQLLQRYQGRLLSFAHARMRGTGDCEDVVQETFISFLRGLGGFRGDSSIETYLFAILNRKIINVFRGRRADVCLLQEAFPGGEDSDAAARIEAPDPTASWYARRDEEHAWQSDVLRAALADLIEGYKRGLNFRDLQIIEMLFYCQLRNRDIAQAAGVRENHVALLKHRVLARIREEIAAQGGAGASCGTDPPDALLSGIWQQERLSCLKRSTIGAYMLGTLEPEWHAYAEFHLEHLGCRFCRANLEDLRSQTQVESGAGLRDRIMQSTVGFLSRGSA